MSEETEPNLGGRPPKYNNAIDLQNKIDQYFKTGVKKKKVSVGKAPNQKVIEIEVPTISGLAYFLGFESRQSFYAYEKKDGFSYTIKRARLFIEQEYEGQLQANNVTGAIFALKNMGWRDKTEIDARVTNDELSPEDREARIAELVAKSQIRT